MRRGQLTDAIRRVFDASGGTYGSPKIWITLVREGWRISVDTVAKTMAGLGLAGRKIRRRRGLTRPGRPGLDQVPYVPGSLVMPRMGSARRGSSRMAGVVLAMLSAPRVFSTPMARLRKVAMARGAVPVWTVEASSA
ncbi:transposase [Streptomyces sp. NPDC059697]|uniref:transposase n=1 Tax=Streptomyces sp. NPDC059697 TaxID=3346912 RepID=UPI0036A6FDFA